MLGEKDTLNPAAFALKLLEGVPTGRLEIFPCGHGVHQELWDDFQRVYGAFLKSVR
jgi:pimeloyl-ACP methyl ester carboxylesterase